MRCTNQGSDYSAEDIQWSCTASLPEEFKLGGTEVICEGYDNADDERVLKGSCGVEYRLLLTEKGEERYGTTWWGGSKSSPSRAPSTNDSEGSTWGSALFMLVFVGVAVWILYSIYLAYINAPPNPRQPRRPGGFWGGGWGGGPGGGGGGPGGNDPWDPPPPYPGKRYGYGQGYSRHEQWRPGFWTGAATGAAAGYMAGNRGQRQEPPVAQRNSSWFGGGGNGGGNVGQSSWSGSRSSGSGSSARYESTGFGSTSRR